MVTSQTWPKGYSNEDSPDLNGKLNCPDLELLAQNSKYGQPGDQLWVRETFREQDTLDFPAFKADIGTSRWNPVVNPDNCKWRPSIYMPRWDSRITLEVTGIKVERLQYISETDAVAEGVETPTIAGVTYRDKFRALWDSINAKRGYGWSQNPWVWVISFRRVS